MSLHARRGTPLVDGEVDVLALVADGLTFAEIATELGITAYAVNSRLTSARRKLGARTSASAIVAAYRTGQLHLGPVRRTP